MKRVGELWRHEAALAWPLLQATAAATVAWLIATHLVRHHEPFFAPVAAVVALNTTTGERGAHAFRLLLGVFIGIGVGELTSLVLGNRYGSLALATFTAMMIARQIGGARVMIARAAASAILTIAVARGEAGVQRLGDATIGAGVALTFSQILFSPEPVALIRRATVAVLEAMAQLLTLTSRLLGEDGDDSNPKSILESERQLRDRLSELLQMMRAADHVVRHSAYWRARRRAVTRESAGARHLELMGGSLLMFVRSALASSPSERRALTPVTRELAEALESLAEDPGDHARRQRAADRAARLRQELDATAPQVPALAATLTSHMLAGDLIAFLGVDLADAPTGDPEALAVPRAPTTHNIPFRP